MITLKEFFTVINFKIAEGYDFGWNCFGSNAYTLSSYNGDQDGWNISATFDTNTQVVYMVEACDYASNSAYRYINPKYKDRFLSQSFIYTINMNTAWDEVDFIDVGSSTEWVNKVLEIIGKQTVDGRVAIAIDMADEDFHTLSMLAHEKDITLNDLVNQILLDEMNSKSGNLAP